MPETKFQKTENKLVLPETKKNSIKDIVRIVLFESNPIKSHVHGIITGCCILWMLIQKDVVPLMIWVLISLLTSLAGILYWRSQMKKSAAKMKEIEKEIQKLNAQIKEKQIHFQKLKDEYLNKGLN
jgi:membrane protein insertase Oxa1/YidC/SpoIIIJ